MNTKIVRYSEIKQFRHVVYDVLDDSQYEETLPSIDFTGTVKLHGTNTAVSYCHEKGIRYQTRNQYISVDSKGGYGFAAFAAEHTEFFQNMFDKLAPNLGDRTITVFGEWAGRGVQKGVAISKLKKMWYIFGIKITHPSNPDIKEWIPLTELDKLLLPEEIQNIETFGVYNITVDFNNPNNSIETLVSLTEQVANECPVGKSFGISGVGEGIVWQGWRYGKHYRFKIKGDKHNVSKQSNIIDIEKLNSINEFVSFSVTEARLNQGIHEVFLSQSIVPDIKYTGNFLKWLCKDILSEEKDTIEKNGLTSKDVSKSISVVGVKWLKNWLMSTT